jgi:hypothetical protein
MARRVRCAACGTEHRAVAGSCWFCGDSVVEAVVVKDALAIVPAWIDNAALSDGRRRIRAPNVAGSHFGLALLALTAVSVCGVAFWIAISFGITVTFLVAPALVQTGRAVRRETARGQPVSAVAKTGAFARSLLLGVAARAAGFATFLSVVLIGLSAGNLLAQLLGNQAIGIVLGGLGFAVGICAGFWVALKINRQRLSI